MGARKPTAEELARVRELSRQWGKVVARRVYGDQGPGLDIDISQMEEIAHAAAQGLAAGTLESATSQQAQALGTEQACPTCGKTCVVKCEQRTIQGLDGPFEQDEPVCYCPTCRRDFFPSTSDSSDGHARVHSRRDVEDRRSQQPRQIS
jgi:hypothetical protein